MSQINSEGESKAPGAPQQGGSGAMTLMEMACRDALTRDIPASERAFIQGMVDQAERDRNGKGWA